MSECSEFKVFNVACFERKYLLRAFNPSTGKFYSCSNSKNLVRFTILSGFKIPAFMTVKQARRKFGAFLKSKNEMVYDVLFGGTRNTMVHKVYHVSSFNYRNIDRVLNICDGIMLKNIDLLFDIDVEKLSGIAMFTVLLNVAKGFKLSKFEVSHLDAQIKLGIIKNKVYQEDFEKLVEQKCICNHCYYGANPPVIEQRKVSRFCYCGEYLNKNAVRSWLAPYKVVPFYDRNYFYINITSGMEYGRRVERCRDLTSPYRSNPYPTNVKYDEREPDVEPMYGDIEVDAYTGLDNFPDCVLTREEVRRNFVNQPEMIDDLPELVDCIACAQHGIGYTDEGECDCGRYKDLYPNWAEEWQEFLDSFN